MSKSLRTEDNNTISSLKEIASLDSCGAKCCKILHMLQNLRN